MSITAPPLHEVPATIFVPPPVEREIASFGRRLGAFLLDGLLVGCVAFALTLPFFSVLSGLGAYGPILGVLSALPYYAILNSKIGHGQTLGKRALHIQVVDTNGDEVPFGRSLLRYLVLAIPYFISDLPLATTRTPWFILWSLRILNLVSLATLYLLIFNRHTRQGIHDLAAGTFVVASDSTGRPSIKPIWKVHWLIVATLMLLLFVGSWLIGKKVSEWGALPQLLADDKLIEQVEGIQSAQIMQQWSSSFGQDKSKHSLIVTIRWSGGSEDREAVANQVARVLITHDTTIQQYDALRIVVVRGYDIGIAHANTTYSFEYTPAEWNSRLSVAPVTFTTGPAKL